MYVVLAVFRSTLGLVLEILRFMMIARAIFSWIPSLSESRVGEFLYTVTEWLIMPIRALFDKFGWNNSMMIDIPFMVTFLIITMARVVI